MIPAETAIRQALAAGPTFWKCKACGSISEVSGAIVGDNWCSSCGACDTMEGFAACNPAAMAELLAEMDRLRDDLTRERNRSQMFADLVRGVAVVLHGPGYSDTSKLPAEVEALQADAERYRWLRDNAYMEFPCSSPRLPGWTPLHVDAAIDAAIDAAKGGE